MLVGEGMILGVGLVLCPVCGVDYEKKKKNPCRKPFRTVHHNKKNFTACKLF